MISKIFEKCRLENRAALVSFITCGDPDINFSESLVKTVCSAGADIVELGTPFSDPMADGKSIQAADRRAIATGLEDIFNMVGRLRADGVDAPFVLFTYMNPLFHYGLERAFERFKQVGIDACLIVDLPMEESDEVLRYTRPLGIDFIPLAAPTSPLERIAEISKNGSGFLYYVMVRGVTGVRSSLPVEFAQRLSEVRKSSKLPVAAGFGISNAEMAHLAAESADAVVIGSKIVDMAHDILETEGKAVALEKVSEFVHTLAAAMKRS